MKKNVMMRVASALLVAVLMTTCAISGTFAKYTTFDKADDSARVAKWGVTVEVTGEDAFAIKYNNTAADDGVKVVAAEKVVAPGTNGTLATVAIAGTPEVMVNISVDVDLDLGDNWIVGGDEYCPLVIKVGDTTLTMTGTVDEFETAVENAVKAELVKTNVAAGTDLSDSLTVTWAWDFYTSDDNDVKDTTLGDAANATIAFACTVTVTQVD